MLFVCDSDEAKKVPFQLEILFPFHTNKINNTAFDNKVQKYSKLTSSLLCQLQFCAVIMNTPPLKLRCIQKPYYRKVKTIEIKQKHA